VISLYIPATHLVHLFEESPAAAKNVPTGQPVHEVDPATALYFPAAHSAQTDGLEAPVAVPYFDTLQFMHDVCSVVFWYLPAAQFMQLVAPFEAFHLPVAQEVQPTRELLPDSARYLPSVHSAHEVEPRTSALYLPAEQVRHSFSLVASATVEYFPLGQDVHSGTLVSLS